MQVADLIILETASPIPKKEMPTPKYHCATCTKMNKDLRCDVFERRVEPEYNRCFNHSHYQPSFTAYVSPAKELLEEHHEEEKNEGFKAA